ncbi:MAG: hypothetical protein JXK04_08915 [Campylobacterales bacterium]|nr:hypothetical protein [Campylobacterales bacterium]
MSSLTEQERIGLEEVFLSISPTRNVFHKWSSWKHNLSKLMKRKQLFSPVFSAGSSVLGAKNPLNKHKITKLFNKIQKRRKF